MGNAEGRRENGEMWLVCRGRKPPMPLSRYVCTYIHNRAHPHVPCPAYGITAYRVHVATFPSQEPRNPNTDRDRHRAPLRGRVPCSRPTQKVQHKPTSSVHPLVVVRTSHDLCDIICSQYCLTQRPRHSYALSNVERSLRPLYRIPGLVPADTAPP